MKNMYVAQLHSRYFEVKVMKFLIIQICRLMPNSEILILKSIFDYIDTIFFSSCSLRYMSRDLKITLIFFLAKQRLAYSLIPDIDFN